MSTTLIQRTKIKKIKNKIDVTEENNYLTPVTTRNKMRNNTDTQFIDFNDHY